MFNRKTTESTTNFTANFKHQKDGFVNLDEYCTILGGDTVVHQVRASQIKRFKQIDPSDSDNGTMVYLFDGETLYVKDDCETIVQLIEDATE